MKQSVWIIWLGAASAIALGTGWVSTLGHGVLWVTLAAHVVEFVVKRPVMPAAGGSMARQRGGSSVIRRKGLAARSS
jgi:hypothetical protein